MRGFRFQDQARLAPVLARPVGVEGLEVAFGSAVVGGDNGADSLEVGDVGRGERGEAGVALDGGVTVIAAVSVRGQSFGWQGTHDSAVSRASFGFVALFVAAAAAAVASCLWDSVLALRCLGVFSSARCRGRAAQGLARVAAVRRSRAEFMAGGQLADSAVARRNVGKPSANHVSRQG